MTWILAGLGVLLLASPVGVCPYRICLGVACPGCGMSRALVALLGGDVAGSLSLHPLAPLVAVQVVAAGLVLLWRRSGRRRRTERRFVPAVLGVNAVLFVAVWLVRLASGALPA